MLRLRPRPLTPTRFAPFGDVIEAVGAHAIEMNDGRCERFADLCRIESDGGAGIAVGIVRSKVATALPYRLAKLERHPLGSQAFIPLKPCRFVVVVGPPREVIEPSDLRAFVTNGRQGVNYRRGTWHMPLVAPEIGQEFLVIDRIANGPNCDECYFAPSVVVSDPGVNV